jgi:hypothetical protein
MIGERPGRPRSPSIHWNAVAIRMGWGRPAPTKAAGLREGPNLGHSPENDCTKDETHESKQSQRVA